MTLWTGRRGAHARRCRDHCLRSSSPVACCPIERACQQAVQSAETSGVRSEEPLRGAGQIGAFPFTRSAAATGSVAQIDFVFSQPLALSLPAPPTQRSLPFLPESLSLPGPPLSVSLPFWPLRKSLPLPPLSRSLPAPPQITSLPARPAALSLPSRAAITSRAGVPTSWSLPEVPAIVTRWPLHVSGAIVVPPGPHPVRTVSWVSSPRPS